MKLDRSRILQIVLFFILLFQTYSYGRVWVIDDGEKIKRDSVDLRFEMGIDNPVWSPDEPVRIFALRNETVALQVVIEAEDEDLTSVTVDLDSLFGPDNSIITNTSNDPEQFVGRSIERFVEHYFYVERQSDGPWGSLYWSNLSAPDEDAWTGWMPDALIPVEVAPSWSSYPLHITKGQNGVLWIDITIPKDQNSGSYTGQILVKNGETVLEILDVDLEIYDAILPDWPLKTMYFYEYPELARRIGGSWNADARDAEKHLWQLYHRHRMTPFYTVFTVSDLEQRLPRLNGQVYTRENGYEGPAQELGDDMLSLGTYGGYGEPDTEDLGKVEAIADRLKSENLFSKLDVFVYAIDENCSSTWGQDWKDLLASSDNINIDSILVGWTCSEELKNQPVDIVMLGTGAYNPDKVEEAKQLDKKVWTYNGHLPQAGSYVTDLDAVSPRVNGLIQAYYDIERWFYWETTFWYDWNPGGLGAYDPFIQPETFHNQYDEWGVGDGVLVYPGKQVDQFTEHSVGMDGVIASIRLKNIRRGIQDAGYYQLAQQINAEKAHELVGQLIHPSISYISRFLRPTWPACGKNFYDLRDSLLQFIVNPTGVDDNDASGSSFEQSFQLNPAYPNPFNASTLISYSLTKADHVKLSVYNLLGQEIQLLINKRQRNGNYQVVWDASEFSSGIYFVRMQAGDTINTRKIILNK